MAWQLALLVAAVTAAVIGRREPRCLVWLIAGAASFLSSKAMLLSGVAGLSLALGNAVGDGLVLLAIAQARRFAWERRVYHVFVLMLVCHALVAADLMPSTLPVLGEPLYPSLLEALNLAAIIIIGKAGWEADYADTGRAHAGRAGGGFHMARRRVAVRAWEAWK